MEWHLPHARMPWYKHNVYFCLTRKPIPRMPSLDILLTKTMERGVFDISWKGDMSVDGKLLPSASVEVIYQDSSCSCTASGLGQKVGAHPVPTRSVTFAKLRYPACIYRPSSCPLIFPVWGGSPGTFPPHNILVHDPAHGEF